MKKYRINTPYGTHYEIDDDGCFLKYDINEWKHPHETWKCTGCAELIAFGNFSFHSLPEFISMIESGHKFTFKNGKPRYTLTDLDHGTRRIHGNTKYHGIQSAYKMEV